MDRHPGMTQADEPLQTSEEISDDCACQHTWPEAYVWGRDSVVHLAAAAQPAVAAFWHVGPPTGSMAICTMAAPQRALLHNGMSNR